MHAHTYMYVVDEVLITLLDSNDRELVYASCGVLLNLMKIPKLRPSLLKNGGVKKYDISMPKSVHIHIHEGGIAVAIVAQWQSTVCLLYTSPSPRDRQKSRMPSSA